MATGTVFLDVDDEITSAAARIRGSEATKVALVLPYGSRIATSRMNFRLLSREALVNNRRLSIVAADPATRALAASAGLPVFASVAEWDASSAASRDTTGESVAGDAEAASAAAASAAPGLWAAETVVGRGEAPESASPASGSRSPRKAAGSFADETQTVGLSTGTPAAGRYAPPAPPRAARIPVAKSRSMARTRGLAVVIAAFVLLALVVGGVGAYVFLPSAHIVVAPRQEAMNIELVVRADPGVTAPDATANVVPAQLLDVPVRVSETFNASDKRIAEKAATGRVEFTSNDTGSANTIAKGTVVSTEGGIKFKTTAAVTLARAQVLPGDPVRIQPSIETVGIVAVKPGTAGNVPANAIRVIPGEDPVLTNVKNPDPTTGGTHEEFAKISQQDVDAAMASLRPKLDEAFTSALADGAGAPANASVFDETAVVGEATPTVDPATLVGLEQATFDLGLTANGTVTAVDASPVMKIAETRLLSNVGADHRLVEGSIEIVPGDPTVSNGQISFPVTAKASRVRILDPAQLLALVKGHSIEDARSILAEFGDAEVTPWPDWVSTMPGLDSRVTIEIAGQTDQRGNGSPVPSGTAGAASPSASVAP